MGIKEKWRSRAEEYSSFSSNLYVSDFITFRLTPLYKDEIFLHEKYVKEGLSIAQIAALSFSSKPTIRKHLIKFGIALRAVHKSHGHHSQPQYGKKFHNGKLVQHQAEQKVIEAIHRMRNQGLSLRTIAHCLTSLNIPTKCHGKRWHPQMIKRLLSISESPSLRSEPALE